MTTAQHADVVIVGSGPCGMAAARTLGESGHGLRILVVEAGPDVGEPPGGNVRNLPPAERSEVYASLRFPGERDSSPPGSRPVAARPGTHLLHEDDGSGDAQTGMPAAAYSTNLGGMGAHWTCACPRPGDSEVIDFIPSDEMDEVLRAAEDALHVTTQGFSVTAASSAVLAALESAYPLVDGQRPPGPMPLACRPRPGLLPEWTGSMSVLGPTAAEVEIRARTLCTRIVREDARVTGVQLRDLTTGTTYDLAASAVVVAAGAFRTPQLLWASGIRPAALGRYLNDQPQIVAPAYVDVPSGEGFTLPSETAAADARDALTGVCWVPFSTAHPFHGQVMQLDTSPIAIAGTDGSDGRLVVGLGWFTTKEVRAEDRVVFDDQAVDENGLPEMRIEYSLSERDTETVAAAVREVRRVAAQLGELVPGTEPILLPAGSSLHYQGTVRMGERDDDTSVCDSHGQVWGLSGLYVAGNGVLPTAIACNPTLTSVALAIRSAHQVIEMLSESRTSRDEKAEASHDT